MVSPLVTQMVEGAPVHTESYSKDAGVHDHIPPDERGVGVFLGDNANL